jgi:hypothetical protein
MYGTPGANVASQKRYTVMVKNKIQQLTPEQQGRAKVAVAASGLTMADGLSQDPMLAQVRLRNGDIVYVKDLPSIDREDPQPNGDYQITLVNDHSGKVEDQGGASWLFVEDDMLHSLTLYSDNSKGNELLPLANDGILQFSTEGYVDEIDENGKYGNFLITTLSPVTVGNDPGTQVLNGNRVLITNAFRAESKGENMATEKVETKVANEITPEERQSIIDEVVATVEADMQPANDIVENEAVTPEEEPAEETPVEEDKKEEEVANKISTTPKAPVANQTPRQSVAVKNDMSGDGAMKAFVNAMRSAAIDRSDKAGVTRAMNEFKKANAITGAAILPESIQSTFFKAWLDNENNNWARFMNSKVGAVYAAETEDTALAHAKGTEKVEQELSLTRRDLKAVALYKKLVIDRQDIYDDESGELVRFRSQELAARIANQILVAALLGGTEPGSVGGTGGGGTRGLFGIIPDAAASSGFGDIVASEVEGESGESAYAAAVRTIGAVNRTAGGNVTSSGRVSGGITLFVPYSSTGDSWITRFLLTPGTDGGFLYPLGTKIEDLLRVDNIIEVPELETSGSIIAIADGAYQLYGENSPEMYPFFDTFDNTDKLLAEQMVAGSLAGYKQAAVYVPAEES